MLTSLYYGRGALRGRALPGVTSTKYACGRIQWSRTDHSFMRRWRQSTAACREGLAPPRNRQYMQCLKKGRKSWKGVCLPHRRVVDHRGICVGMVVYQDIEALSCKVADNIQEAGINGVIGHVIIAYTTHTISRGRVHLRWQHLQIPVWKLKQIRSHAILKTFSPGLPAHDEEIGRLCDMGMLSGLPSTTHSRALWNRDREVISLRESLRGQTYYCGWLSICRYVGSISRVDDIGSDICFTGDGACPRLAHGRVLKQVLQRTRNGIFKSYKLDMQRRATQRKTVME